MSGSQPAAGGDPSMEDILASIRRILNEEEAGAKPAEEVALKAKPAEEPEVFALDASMIVAEPLPPEPIRRDELPSLHGAGAHEQPAAPAPPPAQAAPPEPPQAQAAPPDMPRSEPVLVTAAPPPPSWSPNLVAPEAAAAAAQSVGSLRRTLEAGRHSLAVRTGGPTLDEMVREELRPVLKAWLDANLPALVERLVQAEIERVVGRIDL